MGYDPDTKNFEDSHFFTLDEHEVVGASKNRTLFFLIIGDKHNASYLIYKQALQTLTERPFVKNSYLYAACYSPLDMKAFKKKMNIPQYPMLAVYFKGQIVAEITDLPGKFMADEFILQVAMQALMINLEGNLGAQMYRILKLKGHTEGTRLTPVPKQTLTAERYARMIKNLLTRTKHSIFYSSSLPVFENLYANPKVRQLKLAANRLNPLMYFDKEYKLTKMEKILFKTLISLTEDDFIQFYLPSRERMLHQLSLERADEDKGLMYIYSRKYDVMHRLKNEGKELSRLIKEILTNSSDLVHWIFHYSHDKIASIESFKNKVIDHYNYGLLLVINSDNERNDALNRRAVENLKSVSEDIRDKMMVSMCDVSKQELCREIVLMFELEDHEFPLVRMLYRMRDGSPGEIGQEQIFYKFSFDREIYKETIADIREGRNTNGEWIWQVNSRNDAS